MEYLEAIEINRLVNQSSTTTGQRRYDEGMTQPTDQTVVDWLKALEYEEPQPGVQVWSRTFAQHALTVTVDLNEKRVNYGPEIQVHRQTSTGIKQLESLVVLECVTTLLAVGYPPSSIQLEVPFQLGRKAGGFLDILVLRGEQTYMMIECKTAGAEYQAELTRLKTKATSQLLSYLQQDRATEQVVLYSSKVDSRGNLIREYSGLVASGLVGSNPRELFANWDKRMYNAGLFESAPYTIEEHPIRMKDLRDLTQEDSHVLFNAFKEILRRRAVSDLPNAFNKLFNLFICKIIDEDKSGEDEIAEFQWTGSETSALVLGRLSALYERGMREFLKLDVVDSHGKVAELLQDIAPDRIDEVRQLLAELRQYSSTDFAFIDVFDKSSFDQNSAIVRDLIRLLQTRRLRYTEKQDFLGLFFERLLNTSMKQESGQFFTPPPIAQFVTHALPIERIIDDKVKSGKADFLPYGIDYAAGSGHFLTEFMDRVDKSLQRFDRALLKTKSQQRNADSWSGSLSWAGEFVYGLELDYRLAKTAKVSTFLHGDGDANVMRANGLGNFAKDPDFAKTGGRLRSVSADKDNPAFDVIVANPPYSVPEFSLSLPDGALSFDLWSHLTDRSDGIESLFIERTKQLLVDGGVAGIILPTSLLSNGGLENHARAMIIRYFEIVAIVSLGDRVFIATGTPCVILFLRRRRSAEVDQVQSQIKSFFDTGATAIVRGVVDAFGQYAQLQHGVDAADLREAVRDPNASDLQAIDDYRWDFNSGKKPLEELTAKEVEERDGEFENYVLENETSKLESYLFTMNERTLVVQAPTDRLSKIKFLGYSFSARRRHEGIRLQSGTNLIETPLFDPNDLQNPDKISTLIRSAFDGNLVSVPPSLTQWCTVHRTSELIATDEPQFSWRLRTTPHGDPSAFNGPTKRLGDVFILNIGGTPSRTRPDYFNGSLPWAKISDMGLSTRSSPASVVSTSESITSEAAATKPSMNLLPVGALLLSFKLSIGKVGRAAVPMYTNEAIVSFTPRPRPPGATEWLDDDVLEILLRRLGNRFLGLNQLGDKKIGRTLNLQLLRRLPAPLFSEESREEILRIDRESNMDDDQKASVLEEMIWASAA